MDMGYRIWTGPPVQPDGLTVSIIEPNVTVRVSWRRFHDTNHVSVPGRTRPLENRSPTAVRSTRCPAFLDAKRSYRSCGLCFSTTHRASGV
jgi:hypothetical protein